MIGHPAMVDVQALIMEPVEVKTRREWREAHLGAIRYGIGLGFLGGLLAGLVAFPVLSMVAML